MTFDYIADARPPKGQEHMFCYVWSRWTPEWNERDALSLHSTAKRRFLSRCDVDQKIDFETPQVLPIESCREQEY